MNSSSIVYPYLSTRIGKPFLVSIFLFCSLPIKSWCHKFFELSWATTITVLKPVSCDHVTSFNYDDKKPRYVGLTCWCHLSNIVTDCIFHESMRQGITCSVSFCLFVFCILFVCCLLFFFFCRVILLFSSGWKRWNQLYHYNIRGCGEILSYNGLRQMGLISLQWDLKSETCQGISD